jgi:uncharacterized protein GlcG (DUF336 family)
MDEKLARAMVDAGTEYARSLGIAVTIAVVDAGGHVVMKLRMDGASLISVRMSEDKAWTAASIGMSTGDLTPLVQQPGSDLFGLTTAVDGRIIAFPGGLPVTDGGELVGGVGVSGGSVEDDGRIAAEALRVVPARA